MVLHSDKVRATKVLASAKALGLNVHDVDLHRALQTHNAPHDHVFDKNINSSARLFMRNVAKHKATPKMLKVTTHVAPVASPAVRNKCILLVDADRLRRDDLTAAISSRFKVVVAGSNKDALQVLQMMRVHVVLARLRFQKDSAMDLIHACREKHMNVPIALHTSCVVGYEEMLADCVDAGACGYFDDALPPEILCFRLLDLTKSFDAADAAWRDFKPQPADLLRNNHRASTSGRVQHNVSARSLLASSGGFRRSSKLPSALGQVDEHGDMAAGGPADMSTCMSTLDVQIQDRQNYLAKQQHIQKVMTIQHSVLGLGRPTADKAVADDEPPAAATLNPDLVRKEVPTPTHDQIIQCMYVRPHVVATQVQNHDYAVRTRPPRDAVPQEPLMAHCIIVDPSTLCDSKTVLKRINRAYLALKVGYFDKAIQWCTASLKAEPNHLTKWCHVLRGGVHDILGDHTAALDDFEAAIRIDPAFHQAHFNRSVSLLKIGNDDLALDGIVAAQAHAVGKAARSAAPPEYVRNHALILRRMGRYDEARLVYAALGASSAPTAPPAATRPGEPADAAPGRSAAAGDGEKEQSLEHMLDKAGLTGGLFDALFCQSKDEKAACRAAPQTRTPAMLDLLQSRLYQFDFFARCPEHVVRNVCQALHHVVVRSGETFYLAHDNPHAFYVCLSGTLSVHANLTLSGQDIDTMASSSTHRLRTGDVFGCVGVSVSALMMYLADERTEIMYLTPAAFKDTLEGQWLVEQHARFNVFRRSPVFRMLSDSELGHVVSNSILVRFHKGDIIVAQNEFPKRLYVLYKGICRVEQSFAVAPDTNDDPTDSTPPLATSASAPLNPVKPYHRYLDIPNWPMGFQTHQNTPPKSLSRQTAPCAVGSASTGPVGRPPLTAPTTPPPTITHDIYPPALFGESAYKTIPEKSKCSIIASTLVEALAVDMHQLKSLNLAKELLAAVVANAPLYVDVVKARKMHSSQTQWAAVRGKEALQVNKTRWPVDKARLRYIPNGGSIVVPDGNIVSEESFK